MVSPGTTPEAISALEGATSHTPGPWELHHDTCRHCAERGEREFIIFGPPGGSHGQFSHEPDARLIAAAPEMLAALKVCEAELGFIVKHMGRGGGLYQRAYEVTRAAVRKATGQ